MNKPKTNKRPKVPKIPIIDLPVDKKLINANFEKYIINLDALTINEVALPVRAVDLQASNEQIAYEQSKIFARASQLYYDSWSSSDFLVVFVIYLSDGKFYRVEYNIEAHEWGNLTVVASEETTETVQALPPSLAFPSSDKVVLSLGVNKVFVYSTEERRSIWKKVFEFSHFDNTGLYIQDARFLMNTIEVLVDSVVNHEKTDEKDHKIFDVVASWVTIETTSWEVVRKHDISLPGSVNFITFDETVQKVIVNSSSMFPPVALADAEKTMDTEEEEPLYIWTEYVDENKVVATFNLEPLNLSAEDITVETNKQSLLIMVNGSALINGKLGGPIYPETVKWDILGASSEKLFICFKKLGKDIWDFFVEGDDRGQYEYERELFNEAEKIVEKVCVDAINLFESEQAKVKDSGEAGTSGVCNNDQDDDIDQAEGMSIIYWYDKQKQAVIQKCDITAHQFLFEKKLSGQASHFYIRYDVDGLLYSFVEGGMINTANFAGLGYITVSKENRRYIISPPNHSYIVIAEATNNAYIYYQAAPVTTELVNRRKREPVTTVSKQKIIDLKKRGNFDATKGAKILGAHAENKVFFLLTENNLYAIHIE